MTRFPGVLALLASFAFWSSMSLGLGACGDDGAAADDDDDDNGDDDDDGPGPTFQDDHPRIYLTANRERLATALADGQPEALRFKSIVDAEIGGEDVYDFRSWYAALIGQLTGDPTYCAFAVERVDGFVADEEAMIDAGETPDAAFDSYLEVGAKVGDVMLTYDWCFDTASDEQRTRWLAYAQQAVWNIWHHEEAHWGDTAAEWSGWSVDNPSNNYYYSFLRATMLLGLAAHGEDPDADGWLDFFRDAKIGDQLVPTFTADLVGGGSREGTGYGVSMMRLWELYDLWQGSTGEDLAGLTSHTRSSLFAMLHAIVPTRDRIAPIGDHARDSEASLFDYHRHYLQTLGYIYRDEPVVPAVKQFLAESTVPEMDQPYMYVYDFMYATPDIDEGSLDDVGRAYFAPGAGELFARSSWDDDATWLSFIGGPYTESHAHHDQGSLMIYKGDWLAYDAQIQSTSGLRPEEEMHNLVRISDGGETIRQREGTISEMVAVARGDGWLHAAADTTAAYDGNRAVDRVERELVYLEPDIIVVFDRVASAGGTEQTWQLNSPARPTVAGAEATITGGSYSLHVARVVPEAAETSIEDWAGNDDIGGGFRLDETIAGGDNQFLHVLWIGDAVTDVARSDADGRTGVTINLADGGTATVRFGDTAGDGTLSVGDTDVTLGVGVAPLPE